MMVDRIRRAFDELEPPVCPTCRIEMEWTRSALVASDTIWHLFHCPNCYRTGEGTTKIEAIQIPPEKLSAPAFRRAA
jgi:hypothetical protein